MSVGTPSLTGSHTVKIKGTFKCSVLEGKGLQSQLPSLITSDIKSTGTADNFVLIR